MKKSIIILLCLISGFTTGFAQQDAQFTLFPWASLYYNPGAAGEQSNTLCFTGIFRQQFMGFNDVYKNSEGNQVSDNTSIQDILFNMEFYSRKIRGAIGLSFVKDKIGYFDNIGIRLGYAYKLNLGPGKLGIGIQASLINQSVNAERFRPSQEGDPIIQQLGESYLDLDFNFGLYYKTDRWYAGLSGTQLLGPSSLPLSGGEELKLARQLYLHGGYIWTLPWNPSWTIEPQALLKFADFTAPQLDLMVLTRYNNILWAGLSYRVYDAVSVLFGARPFYNSSNNYLKGLDIGVAYSFTTSKLGLYSSKKSSGDIEIMLRYCFDIYRQEVFSGYGSTRSIYKNQY